jgi:DNA (cytosine-5)-methyltransferase 1
VEENPETSKTLDAASGLYPNCSQGGTAVLMQTGSGSDPELMATLCAKDNEKWGCNQWVNEGKAVIGFQSTANACDAAAAGVNVSPTQKTDPMAVASGLSVRRLTPTECERLQGFPDSYTQIPWRGKEAENCPDGPRYKALGNSFAVPVVRWIGERIQAVEAL